MGDFIFVGLNKNSAKSFFYVYKTQKLWYNYVIKIIFDIFIDSEENMKKQAFFRFWLIVCIIALTISFASCDETVAPAGTTAAVIETDEITNESEATITPDTTSVPETTEAPHVHVWSSWTTTLEATCTSEGKQTRTCSCGENETESISAIGHTEVIDSAVAATCTTEGKTEGKHCSICKAVIVKQNTISKTDHNYGEWKITTTATCTAKGKQERTCCTCGRKESQTVSALGHTESEWIIDKAPTCQSAGSQHTDCTICNKKVQTQTLKANSTHKYEGNFCELCGKKSPDFEFPSGYITTKPTEIETEYCILKMDQNVYVVDSVAEKVDIVCRALEEVTGLKFKNDTYGKDKVVINVTRGEEPWGITGEDEEPFPEYTVTSTREITIGPGGLFISQSDVLIHELVHALHFSQTKWQPHDIFIEGFAQYVTMLALQYLSEHHPDIQYTIAYVDYLVKCAVIYTDELYKEKIEYWFEHPFTHMPHNHSEDAYHYSIGFRIMWYLHDTYKDYTKWILFREVTDPSSNYRHPNINNEDWFAEIKQIYGNDILDNFYPWLKANEILFEFDLNTRDTFDLTNIEYITLYPHFDTSANFTETGKITYNNLLIDIEEAKKYLTEYKGKHVKYLHFSGMNDTLVSYYDKDGNLIKESTTNTWIDDNVSYIKLNGSGTINNLHVRGMADCIENGMAFVAKHNAIAQSWTSYYQLEYIYEPQDSHLIVPSEVNGLPVKSISNGYNGTAGGNLNQVTEITVCENIEVIYGSAFGNLKNVKKIHLPYTLKTINNQLRLPTGIEIYYVGTKSDWNAIQKADNWDSRLNAYTIHCTDGDITKGN